jgi:hypothetical protein
MTMIARLIRILKVMGLMVYLIEYGFIEDLCRLLAGSSSSYHRVPRLGFASPGANTLPPAAQAGTRVSVIVHLLARKTLAACNSGLEPSDCAPSVVSFA